MSWCRKFDRLDCGGTDPSGYNVCKVHIDFYSYMSLFVRIMQQKNAERSKLELKQLHKVVRLLILPTACYHTGIEEYFVRLQHISATTEKRGRPSSP